MANGLVIFGTSNYSNPSWVSEPEVRGTWSLIQTCLLTLGLCVFSAIHPNVFHRGSPSWWKFLLRLKWLVIALIAPEFIVFNAWSERRQAVRIGRLLRHRAGQGAAKKCPFSGWFSYKAKNALADPESIVSGSSDNETIHPTSSGGSSTLPSQKIEEEHFSLVHGFVIVMGGLAVDMSNDPERTWPTYCNRLTLTPACFEECFGRDEFLNIDLGFLKKETISSREKTDHLAKALIIIQALWFCVQFIGRLAQALPVSLLELNTFAHALCALFVYVLWWHKPGVMEEQFVLRTEESEALRNLCAAQWASGASGMLYEAQGATRTNRHRPLSLSGWRPVYVHGGSELVMNLCRGRQNMTLCPGAGEDWYIFDHVDRWFYYPHLTAPDEAERQRIRVRDTAEVVTRFVPGEIITGTTMKLSPIFLSLDVDQITLRRWRRTFEHDEYSHNYTVWLRDRQPNFAWPRGLDDSVDGPKISQELVNSLFMLLVTSLCYGGFHMLAWDSAALAPSGHKRVLWKVASLLVMTVGPLGMVMWVGLKLWRGADAHLRLNQAMSVGFGAFGIALFVAYMASRVYLIAEVVLVIPYLDPGVYKTLALSEYWPHLG